MSYFWLMALNEFIFPFGTSTIILYNLAVLFDLQPLRIEPDPTYEVGTLSFYFILPIRAKFGTFFNVHAKKRIR